MSGAISACDKQKMVDNYVRNHNVYNSNESWGVNVIALTRYIKEKKLTSSDITEEILEKFKTD